MDEFLSDENDMSENLDIYQSPPSKLINFEADYGETLSQYLTNVGEPGQPFYRADEEHDINRLHQYGYGNPSDSEKEAQRLALLRMTGTDIAATPPQTSSKSINQRRNYNYPRA